MEFSIGDLVCLDFWTDDEPQESYENPDNIGLVVGFEGGGLYPRVEWITKPFNWVSDVTWEDSSKLLLLSGDKDGV